MNHTNFFTNEIENYIEEIRNKENIITKLEFEIIELKIINKTCIMKLSQINI